MKKIKVTDKHNILELLKRYKRESVYRDKIKAIGLFGSFANGNYSGSSDIDIFIRLDPAKMFDLISIKRELEELLGRKVDLIMLRDSMNRYLKNQIKQKGIYV
jgi:uncharacterized protein